MAYTCSFSIQWIAILGTLFLLFTTFQSDAFAPYHDSILLVPTRKQSSHYSPSRNACFGVLEMKGGPTDKEGTDSSEGFLGGIKDFFGNLDAVADDFFYKRMGKGEIFYGKRRYKPSGDVEGEYQGMGLSDKLKIDMAREYREEWLEEKRMRDEIRMLREQKEQREE